MIKAHEAYVEWQERWRRIWLENSLMGIMQAETEAYGEHLDWFWRNRS